MRAMSELRVSCGIDWAAGPTHNAAPAPAPSAMAVLGAGVGSRGPSCADMKGPTEVVAIEAAGTTALPQFVCLKKKQVGSLNHVLRVTQL